MGSNMKFKDYEWINNPKQITIEQSKNIKEFNLPYVGSCLQNFGNEKKIVKGTGEFFGETAKEQFNDLYQVYEQKESGILSIPGIESFTAMFKSIKMSLDATPDFIAYTFEFWENQENEINNQISTVPDYHIVREGEDLFDIAYLYDTTAANLMELNPTIKRPDELEVGSKVMLR